MSMISASITGLAPLEALLARLSRFRASGLMPMLGNMAKSQHIRRVVSEKTSPDGAAWAALRPFTVDKKGSSNIMIDSGSLAGAFYSRASDIQANIGNQTSYLGFHQSGTSKMVARPIIGLSDANLAEIKAAANAFIAARLGI
jgi:phage gpG-like protein